MATPLGGDQPCGGRASRERVVREAGANLADLHGIGTLPRVGSVGVADGDLAVLDAVYAPIETRLLREAAAAGATTVDGAWMLLFQGVEAFEIWTGESAPVDAMNAALRAALE